MSGSDATDTPLGRADGARDRGEWAAAAAHYAAHLEDHPNDWPTLVQHGHALKEGGRLDTALVAYAAAEALAPEDADLQLQIGHLLKRQGRLEAAALRYARAAVLDPADPQAAFEAVASARLLPRDAPAPMLRPSGADPRLVFDLTDMLDHFRVRRTPTGIQRVTLGILRPLLDGSLPAGATAGLPTAFAAFDSGSGLWRRVDRAGFATLAALSGTGAATDDPDWIAASKAMDLSRSKAGPVRFAPGAVLVNLGNAFGIPDYYRGLRWAMQTAGVRWLPFVHDCVPLEVPEHCLADMLCDYARWFAGLGLHAAGFLCNSENTRADVTRHLASVLPGHAVAGSVVRLDADPRGGVTPAMSALAEIPGLRPGEPFALFCATIESRKDHHLVFSAWLTLLRRHGPARIPRLVCAGRQGWHAQAALDLLAQSPLLRRHVVLTGEISDEALAALYAACRFTVYNSHYEGWGLPVTESLAHGKVPVVARHSSLTEAGGTAAVYFAPRSEPDLVAALEPLMLDPAALPAAAARLAEAPLRPWSALTLDVLAAVRALPPTPLPAPRPGPTIEPGRRYPTVLSRATRPALALAMADRLRDGNGWFPAETWGAWSRPGPAALTLPLPEGMQREPLRLYLDIRPPPLALNLRIALRSGGQEIAAEIRLQPGPDFTAALDLPPLAEARLLEIDIDSGAGVRLADLGGDDDRIIGIGLKAVMLCRADDLLARLAYLEAVRTTPAEVETA